MPVSEVVDGTVKGVLGGAAMRLAGASIINNAVSTLGGMAGYYIGCDYGAIVGSIAGAAAADKYHKVYPEQTRLIPPEQTHETSYSQQRVNGGTVIETRNVRQREPSYKEPKQKKMLISRLGDAIKDITPSNRTPPSQKIKESKLLKDIEQQQRTYGTIQQSDIEPQDPKPSTITQLTEGVKDIYRRLSGRKKGQYAQLPTSDPDFKTTLESSKREGQKQGTYAILPQEEMDFETEMEAMMRSARKKNPKTQVSLLDTPVPTQTWPAMEQFKTQNEATIRKSIVRTDKAEREERIKQGLLSPPPKPPKQPLTPKQQLIVNNFNQLVAKTQTQKKESEYLSVLKDAEPLIYKRELLRMKKQLEKKSDDYSSQIAALEARKAVLQPDIEKHEATKLQTAMRGKIARNTLQKTRTSKNTAATKIQQTIRGKIARNKIINDCEDQVTRVENILSSTRSNHNEQRPQGLRKAKKALQDRKSEITSRGKTDLTRDQKKEETKRLNTLIEQYENVITKRKTGPKVKEIVEQFGGAAFTPKKK